MNDDKSEPKSFFSALEHAEESLGALETVLKKSPAKDRQKIEYCIAATKGIPIPESPLQYHHLFCIFVTGLGQAISSKNQDYAEDAIKQLKQWAKTTELNPL